MICKLCGWDKPETEFNPGRRQCKSCFYDRNKWRKSTYQQARYRETKRENADKEISDLYMIEERNETYTACEDFNFHWRKQDVKRFVELWNEGYSLGAISEALERPDFEVLLLVLDQLTLEEIRQRRSGILGNLSGRYRLVKIPELEVAE